MYGLDDDYIWHLAELKGTKEEKESKREDDLLLLNHLNNTLRAAAISIILAHVS